MGISRQNVKHTNRWTDRQTNIHKTVSV